MADRASLRPPVEAPRWIASALHCTANRDPIGPQTIAVDRITSHLVPGVLALSRRAQYFALYPFLLHEYETRRSTPTKCTLSGFVKVCEYEYALAAQLCPTCRSLPTGVFGNERARPAVNAAAQVFARDESVESEQGGYGLFHYHRAPDVDLVAPCRCRPLG